MFQNAGGTRYGTISKRLFCSALTDTFHRHRFSEELLFQIVSHYGTGAEDIFNGAKELVAWCDFVEDVMGAEGNANADPNAVSFGGGMNDGKSRDLDGTVDRVPDPPETLKPWILVLSQKVKAEGIDLELCFQAAGGTRYGTISKRLFQSALTTYFSRLHITQEVLHELVTAYGVGMPDHQHGGKQQCAWRDFVEDVYKGCDITDPEMVAWAADLAATRGARIG